MLDEGAEDASVEFGYDEVAVNDKFGVQHGMEALGLVVKETAAIPFPGPVAAEVEGSGINP
jgi:hypothetical protein